MLAAELLLFQIAVSKIIFIYGSDIFNCQINEGLLKELDCIIMVEQKLGVHP